MESLAETNALAYLSKASAAKKKFYKFDTSAQLFQTHLLHFPLTDPRLQNFIACTFK